jgi:dUTP pyrophosphatase
MEDIEKVTAETWKRLQDELRYELKSIKIGFKKMHPDAKIPHMAKEGDGAFDIYSCEDTTIAPRSTKAIDCGFGLEIPSNYKVMINGRSGLASRGIFCHVGTVDSGYRGKLGTILYNLNDTSYEIKKGDRVGQISLQQVIDTTFEEVVELSTTARGETGFGSSGK